MDRIKKIGIIGDFDSSRESQIKTNESLTHASKKLCITLDSDWIPTKSLNADSRELIVTSFDAIWAGPGNYENSSGVLGAIQYCRENEIPFLGT